MFYYLGRKKRLANKYPEPSAESDTIVEPFAGSAAYSLHGERWRKNVIVNDMDPDVFDVWNYLKAASMTNILDLPDMSKGESISAHTLLASAERWLISYHINPGTSTYHNVCTTFGETVWNRAKRDIALNLHKIKHWTILNQEYHTIENRNATWFVDPPYHSSGLFYRTNTLAYRYDKLAEWSLEREGSLIVCEQEGASWLPFSPLCPNRCARGGKTKDEVVFIR